MHLHFASLVPCALAFALSAVASAKADDNDNERKAAEVRRQLKAIQQIEGMQEKGAFIVSEGPGGPESDAPQLRKVYQVTLLTPQQTDVVDRCLKIAEDLGPFQSLSLNYMPVTEEGLRWLKSRMTLTSLTVSAISQDELRHLADMPQLVKLRISGRFGDEDLFHLRNLTNLEYLDLHYVNLKGPGLLHLKGLKNLKTLYVSVPAHSPYLPQLQRALPGLEFK